MKIKFLTAPPARREYKAGDVVEFTGPVALTYARKFIARGWAEEVVEEAPAEPAAPVAPVETTDGLGNRQPLPQSAPPAAPVQAQIIRIKGGKHNVVALGRIVNETPLTAAEAEALRQRVLAGDFKVEPLPQ